MTRTTLTKSLHTVTAVGTLAAHLYKLQGSTIPEATRDALALMGYPADWAETDPTFAACIIKARKIVGAK